MAEIVITAFVEVLIEKLSGGVTKLVSQSVGKGKKYRKILKEWESELKMIQAVLVDAEQKQSSSQAVKKWLEDLQGVAFDMEDVLGDFDIQAQAREIKMANASGVLGSLKNKVKRHSMVKLKNPGKIDDITECLKRIQSQRQTMGLSVQSIMQDHTPPTEALRSQRESASVPSKGEVFGRNADKQRIVNKLLKDNESDENYVVIPIVGNGGIGKTTLAQSVFNDKELEGRFDLKAWVCVSDVFDVKRITTTICKAVVGRGAAVDFGTLDEAQTQLKEVLTGKKLLIVLDDIWNEEYDKWDKLQTPFQYATKGSRVIMTTRNKDIARMMDTSPSHNNVINLGILSDNDCWCVFQQHANNDPNLVELRDDIIKKCKGLPLAAKALGGLMKKTVGMKQRRRILESNPWSKDDDVLEVLRLSYHYLPSHLKCMFAYCSVLRKDYEFTKWEIILLWMAQGFLPENEEERMEDLGNIYFDDLESRSLFEQSPDDEDMFVMHDLIHDLALWAAGGNCYVMGTKDITQVHNWQRIRHVFFTKHGCTTLESQLPVASQLRTFYCDDNQYIENLNFIEDFRYVRTLRLASRTVGVLPECIGELQHLRFLSLDFERVEELPKSISNLWNLQTLYLEGYSRLKKIPNISSLGKLRHLKIEGTSLEEMPMGFEKLTNLQSLDKFFLGHGCGARLRELKDMNHLEAELRIFGLENVSMSEDAREAQLHKKCRLDKLYLEWGNKRDEVDDNTEREVAEQLKPHSSIKECSLKYYKGLAFPGWLGDPCFNNMVDLSLVYCEECECLPPLGQLPRLESLWIEGMDGIVQVGPEFYGNLTCTTPFPTLKSLKFEKMKCWERWLLVDNDRAFPCLELLKIYNCDSLQGDVPPHLPSLKTLRIEKCKQLNVSVPLQSLPLLEDLEVRECKIQLIAIEGTVKEELELSPSAKGNTPCEHPHLTSLIIQNSPSLISLPDGLLLPALKTLEIIDCGNMESLPSEMHRYTSLQRLQVYNSPKIQCFPEGGLPKNLKQLSIRNLTINRLPSLTSSLSRLYVGDIPNLKSISCSTLPNLTDLCIKDCPELESFEDHALPPQLLSLCIAKCPKLQFFLQEILQGGLPLPTNLKRLKMPNSFYCQFTHKPKEDLSLPSFVSTIHITGNQNVKNLSVVDGTIPLTDLHVQDWPKPESVVGNLTSLSRLSLQSCPKLQSFPEIGLLLNLKFLSIGGVPIDKPIQEWGLHLLTSLDRLTLCNLGSCTDAVRRIPGPDDLQLPSSLSHLGIQGFQNLKSISCSTLPNLFYLTISRCPQLESFADSHPSRLRRVFISECALIKPCLVRNPRCYIEMDGDNWSLR